MGKKSPQKRATISNPPTVEEVGGMLHRPNRKAPSDAEQNRIVAKAAKAKDEATKDRKLKKANRPPTANFDDLGFTEIAEGVRLGDDWPRHELVYLRFEGAQVKTESWEGPKGLETRVTVAIPRVAAEKFLALSPVPNDPLAGLRRHMMMTTDKDDGQV